jgi:hypothetical protein
LTVPKELILGSPIQNTFNIDCNKPDLKAWAFMAVKVIHIRPPEMKMSAHIIEDGISKDSDLYKNDRACLLLETHIILLVSHSNHLLLQSKVNLLQVGGGS